MAEQKTSEPFMQQYMGGLMGSLFLPEFAQAFASYKPQEYQQLFGDPGDKLRKGGKGGITSGEGASMAGGTPTELAQNWDPNAASHAQGGMPTDVKNPYHRYVMDYKPFDFLASNFMGRPGGPSAQETDIMNKSLGGLTAGLDQSKLRAIADRGNQMSQGLTGSNGLPNMDNVGNLLRSILGSFGQAPQAPQIQQSLVGGGIHGPLAALSGLLGIS